MGCADTFRSKRMSLLLWLGHCLCRHHRHHRQHPRSDDGVHGLHRCAHGRAWSFPRGTQSGLLPWHGDQWTNASLAGPRARSLGRTQNGGGLGGRHRRGPFLPCCLRTDKPRIRSRATGGVRGVCGDRYRLLPRARGGARSVVHDLPQRHRQMVRSPAWPCHGDQQYPRVVQFFALAQMD